MPCGNRQNNILIASIIGLFSVWFYLSLFYQTYRTSPANFKERIIPKAPSYRKQKNIVMVTKKYTLIRKAMLLPMGLIACTATLRAQVQPKAPMVVNTKTPIVRPVLENCVVSQNRTNAQPFETSIDIKAWVENEKANRNVLRFESNLPIAKAGITVFKKGAAPLNHTTSFPGNSKSGHFYLDAPTYKDGDEYLVSYYVKGHEDKPVWSTWVKREIGK